MGRGQEFWCGPGAGAPASGYQEEPAIQISLVLFPGQIVPTIRIILYVIEQLYFRRDIMVAPVIPFRAVTAAMAVNRYQEFIPHAVLQTDVRRFWILEKEYTPEDNIEEVVPDACIELILNFGSAYVQITGSSPRQLPNVCLVGLLSKPLILQADGVVKIVAVRFFAWGVLPFLKNEPQRGSLMSVDLDEAWRSEVSKIAAKVHAGEYQEAETSSIVPRS